MKEPCGAECDEEAEYRVSFVVESLEMLDKGKNLMLEDVLMVITWDGNVVKLMTAEEDAETFDKSLELLIHATPTNFSKKLRMCPIMFDLSRKCNELGTTKLTISDCFADAVLCDDFNSQTVTNEFKFFKDEVETARMSAHFRVQRQQDDGSGANIYSSLNAKKQKKKQTPKKKPKPKQIKKEKKKTAKGADGSGLGADETEDDDDDSDIDSDADNECKLFACPDEMPEHCKAKLGLDENFYRIINGNLINVKEKIGPCGEKCPVAKKLIRDFRRSTTADTKVPTLRKNLEAETFADQPESSKSRCEQSPDVPFKFNLIDQNLSEEDLLRKLCDKYGLKVDDIRSVGRQIDAKKCKILKKQKPKSKKPKRKVKKVAPMKVKTEW